MDSEERGIFLGRLDAGINGFNDRMDRFDKRLDRIEEMLEKKRSFKWILKAIIAFFVGKHGG